MSCDRPTRHAILLGASNLRQGLRTVVRTLADGLAPPLHIWTACGFGRSYGVSTWVPVRSLAGITQCGLWSALAEALPAGGASAESKPPLALITDVGNDLLYRIEVPRILAWVEECARRLTAYRVQLAITLPPAERLRQLSNWRFVATRSLFFPLSPLTRDLMFAEVDQLCVGLTDMAGRLGAQVVTPPLEWYGIDPIHLRASRRAVAWKTIATAWPDFAAESAARAAASDRSTQRPGFFWYPRPAKRRVLGFDRMAAQPSFRSDDLQVSLY